MDELYFSENLYIFKNNILNEAIKTESEQSLSDKVGKFGEYISVENNAKNFLKMLVGVELNNVKYTSFKNAWKKTQNIPDLVSYNFSAFSFTRYTTELLNFVNEVTSANIQNPIITQINDLIPQVTSEIIKYININFSGLKLKQDISIYTIFSNKNYEKLDNVINALFEIPNNGASEKEKNKDDAANAIFNLYTQHSKLEKFNKLLDLLYCKNK